MRLRNALVAVVIVTMILCLVLFATAYMVGQQNIDISRIDNRINSIQQRIDRINLLLTEIEMNLSAVNARLVDRAFGRWPR